MCESGLEGKWILDCGVSDTISYDNRNFLTSHTPLKTIIETANGECISVKGDETIDISPNIRLNNCVFVPNLSRKLLSISQLTKTLNCVVSRIPMVVLCKILKQGGSLDVEIEKDGLDYVDSMSYQGCASLTHGSVENRLWMWHRQ